MDLASIVQTITVYAIPVLFAITIHEAAHGYAARHLGDPTAEMLGRISLNPFKHIDPIGTVVMPLLLLFLTKGAFVFGYAKPVPVQMSKLRNPRRDMMWVALAGPMSNLAQALAWLMAAIVLSGVGLSEPFFFKVCEAGVIVNLVLFALNLFPLPPLDGGRVLVGLLPPGPAVGLARIEPYGFFIVIALLYTGILAQWWLLPLIGLAQQMLLLLTAPLQWLFG
ncbi:site-2 protease family protein [Hydrogenophaga sp. 5NK40-0174]|uniref:site-2 protease family protein n=1 Tax=Hydrogenophaga sp. 5NK40-0174 TaxID=3127649 RepID=UPI00310514E0